jgi:hypothetical protein
VVFRGAAWRRQDAYATLPCASGEFQPSFAMRNSRMAVSRLIGGTRVASDLFDTLIIPLPQTENARLVELSFYLRSSRNALWRKLMNSLDLRPQACVLDSRDGVP